ncbi:MAG TPA: hypothetical protein VNM14_04425 [Planctomycetota bacterium]|jgi:hypothetical protein|nr:hypothetical protein [Planctomycetota bacterium]
MIAFLGRLLKAYAVLAAFGMTLLLLVIASLVLSGALNRERVRESFQVLRGRGPAPVRIAEPPPPDALAERERILEKRTQELQKLEERTTERLTMIRAEQETLDRKRQEFLTASSASKKAQEEASQANSDAELSANVPILSRMEAPGIVAVLKAGDDARFVRYLRALRPGKAAEVLEAIRTDPQFEDDFRRVPPEAPAGTRPRADRLLEEFKKAP